MRYGDQSSAQALVEMRNLLQTETEGWYVNFWVKIWVFAQAVSRARIYCKFLCLLLKLQVSYFSLYIMFKLLLETSTNSCCAKLPFLKYSIFSVLYSCVAVVRVQLTTLLMVVRKLSFLQAHLSIAFTVGWQDFQVMTSLLGVHIERATWMCWVAFFFFSFRALQRPNRGKDEPHFWWAIGVVRWAGSEGHAILEWRYTIHRLQWSLAWVVPH